MTLNFEGGADDIPTYSLCRPALLRREGRQGITSAAGSTARSSFSAPCWMSKIASFTSKRFATGKEGVRAPRCTDDSKPVHTAVPSQFDCRNLYPCHRGQQSDRAERRDRVGQAAHFPDRGRLRSARGRGGPAAQADGRCPDFPWPSRAIGVVDATVGVPQWAGASARASPSSQASARWSRRSAIASCVDRQGPPAAAEELCAVSGARMSSTGCWRRTSCRSSAARPATSPCSFPTSRAFR